MTLQVRSTDGYRILSRRSQGRNLSGVFSTLKSLYRSDLRLRKDTFNRRGAEEACRFTLWAHNYDVIRISGNHYISSPLQKQYVKLDVKRSQYPRTYDRYVSPVIITPFTPLQKQDVKLDVKCSQYHRTYDRYVSPVSLHFSRFTEAASSTH